MRKKIVLLLLSLLLALAVAACFPEEDDSDPCPGKVCCRISGNWDSEIDSTYECTESYHCTGPGKEVMSNKSKCKKQ